MKKQANSFMTVSFFDSLTFHADISDIRKSVTEIFLSLMCELNMNSCERSVSLRYTRV